MPLTPMLLVTDVEASSKWLCSVIPLKSVHGGPEFEMLADETGAVVMWLHATDSTHDHAQLTDMRAGAFTGGTIFYLQISDVDLAYEKAKKAGARILEEPYHNPRAGFFEFTFEEPNGYRFAVHSARLGAGQATSDNDA